MNTIPFTLDRRQIVTWAASLAAGGAVPAWAQSVSHGRGSGVGTLSGEDIRLTVGNGESSYT